MKILVCVSRPLLYMGVAYAEGATIEADPLGANELIASGRAVLADPAAAGVVRAAAIAERNRLLGALDRAERVRCAEWVLNRKRA